MGILFPQEEFTKLKDYLILYRCALKNVETRFDVLLEDFKNLQKYNPIEHIKSRLKSPESIAEKLHRLGLEITAENAYQHLTDIAGLRCICSYAKDIQSIATSLKYQPDIVVRSEKDYITRPKSSGYRSYHIIFDVPIYLSDAAMTLPVELQIRTQAMDFWASLEHKVRYKYKDHMPEHLATALIECADEIAEMDERMYHIQELVEMSHVHTER